MELFSLSLVVALMLGSNLFLYLLKTSKTCENPDSTIHVVGREILLASTCLRIFGHESFIDMSAKTPSLSTLLC